MSTILVVAAHPDDETLGCGGTIARLVAEGHSVHVRILAEGVTSRTVRNICDNMVDIQERLVHCDDACAVLGVASVKSAQLPDQQLDALPVIDLARQIEAWVVELAPSVVYTHWAGDLNQDHRTVAEATLIATRPQPGACVRDVYAYPVLSSTEWNFGRSALAFAPNVFVDISVTLFRKMQAMQCYEAEVRPWPHPRSPEAIHIEARHWGSVAGVESAEAFVLLRSVS